MGNNSGKDSVSESRTKLPLFCGCCKGKDEFDLHLDDDVGVKLEPKFKQVSDVPKVKHNIPRLDLEKVHREQRAQLQ